jgi:hypothetical protein
MALDWLFLALCIILLLYVSDLEGLIQMAAADLQKLLDNMKRAQGITDRAAQDAIKHAAIMDSFEKRLDLNHDNMAQIEEYDKMMGLMDLEGSNKGPALTTTFPSSTKVTVHSSTGAVFHPDGRQL